MFKNNSVKFLLFVFAASLFFACSGNHQKQTQNQEEGFVDPRENTHMQRTKTDTLAVLYNVKKYLDFLKENQTDSAMAMLYEQIGDNEPIALNDSRKDEILKQLKVFPVLDYEILQLNMFSEDNCEVLYNVKYFEKDPDNPMQNTIQCIIKPVRYGYYWYLTIPESVGQPPIE